MTNWAVPTDAPPRSSISPKCAGRPRSRRPGVSDRFTRVMIGPFHGFVPTPGLRFERNHAWLPSWSLAKPWTGDTSQSTPSPQDTERVEEYASGWPMLSLVARRRGSVMTPIDQRATEGIWYKGTKLVRPTTPIWPGFLVDSLTLSAPLWIACGLCWAHRIGLFRRAYQCKACGYDLRGQTLPGCPECGAGRVASL